MAATVFQFCRGQETRAGASLRVGEDQQAVGILELREEVCPAEGRDQVCPMPPEGPVRSRLRTGNWI